MYFMEDTREADRLAMKVAPESWVATYLPKTSLHGVCEALDVGCGPGVIARTLARRHPQLQVTGLDISPERVARAMQRNADTPNVAIVHGSAAQMPFRDESFDLVYCRFLLEYLPDRDAAVAEMVRVCRPGGSVVLQDLDGQLLWHFPCDEQMAGGIGRVLRRLSATGFDPYVGRKLYSLAWSAGLRAIDVRIEPYHLIAGRIDERNYELWKLKLDIALPFMTKALGSRDEAEQLSAAFLSHLQREDTLTYSIAFTVSGRKERT